jgi:arabinogalactan oligomer / maltooligosaccharide transport system permease protein
VKRSRGGWRDVPAHVFLVAVGLFCLFPIAVVISAAMNPNGSITAVDFVPAAVSWDNFTILFGNPNVPYVTWIRNSLIIASLNGSVSVIIGAAAAYAFSRLRFAGRKIGLLALLLIQVFPQFLALAAIYIIMSEVYEVFPAFGIGSLNGLFLVYLGGAMGINAWLLKGFFDSIPMELDESAKVDGASPAQIYWIIILPLAVPVLAVVMLLSFIGTFNEFVIASVFIQDLNDRTLAVGLQQFVGSQYEQNWGPFAAGSLIAAVPMVALFLLLQKYIVGGLTQGAVKG